MDTLKRELDILTSSELFEVISDSTKADLKVKLYPIQQSFVCGQPFIVSMITVGQLPIILFDRYLYEFDEIEKGKITERRVELKIAERVWFWDIFAFNKKLEKQFYKNTKRTKNNLSQ